jgi:hypothetical protein
VKFSGIFTSPTQKLLGTQKFSHLKMYYNDCNRPLPKRVKKSKHASSSDNNEDKILKTGISIPDVHERGHPNTTAKAYIEA